MSSPSASISTASTSPFIRHLPTEIRVEIYILLLVNPILGTLAPDELARTGRTKYDLSPGILQTCRHIYEEASEVLYSQTFAAQFNPHHPNILAPVLRASIADANCGSDLNIATNWEAMRKVRGWNIFLDPDPIRFHDIRQFRQLCQVICDSRPRHVNITVYKNPHPTVPSHEVMEPWELLRPLINVRNVGLLTFNDRIPPASCPSGAEIMEGLENGKMILVTGGPNPTCQRMLKKFAEGSLPVERLFEMYHHLAKFVFSFERHVAFKFSHSPGGSEGDLNFDNALRHCAYPTCLQQIWETDRYRPLENHSHPAFAASHRIYDLVDCGLRNACICAHDVDSPHVFKIERERIVRQLSPCFDRLSIASKEVDKYLCENGDLGQQIETDRQGNGKAGDGTEEKAAHLWGRIANYADLFERHKVPDVAPGSTRLSQDVPHPARKWEREILLDRLAWMLENHDYREFDSVVTQVLAEMNGRLEKMRHAGEHLFDADGYIEWRCNVKMNFLPNEGK